MADQQTVVVRGIRFGFEVHGVGPRNIIWGHEGNSSRAIEDRTPLFDLAELYALGRVLRYDARGHGVTDVTTGPRDYSWDEMAADQLSLATQCDMDQYVAAGASLGAVTALHAALLAPHRVKALVMVKPPTAWEERSQLHDLYMATADAIERDGIGVVLNGATKQAVPHAVAEEPAFAAGRQASLAELDPERLAAFFRGTAVANYPDRDRLSSIATPTRIYAWTGDPVHPVEVAEELAERIPGAELSVASTWAEVQAWPADICAFLAR